MEYTCGCNNKELCKTAKQLIQKLNLAQALYFTFREHKYFTAWRKAKDNLHDHYYPSPTITA